MESQLIANIKKNFNIIDFHPMDFYTEQLKISSKEMKRIASEDFPQIVYKNKVQFIKQLIPIIEEIKINSL